MQRIERYGVIALVFLLVTVAAVSFWGDGAQEKRAKGRQEEVASKDAARNEPASTTPPATERRAEQRPQGGRPVYEPRTEPPLPVGPPTDPRRAAEGARRAEERPEPEVVELDPLPRQEPAQPATAEERRREVQRGRPERGQAEPAREPEPQAQPARSTPSLPETEVEVIGDLRGGGAPQTVEYTVKPGETLSEIALATLGSTTRWRSIQTLNAGLDPTRLRAGQKILLPKGAVFSVAPGAPAPSKPRVNGGGGRGRHVIQRGDTLSGIAAAKLGDAGRWREIVALNPGLDPNALPVAKTIVLPAPGEEAPAARLASVTPPASARREKENRVR